LGLAAATGLSLATTGPSRGQSRPSDPSIDRLATVRRHNPRVNKPDLFAALTVGNGNFAFTADVTGLQTFSDFYQTDFPLCTAAHWGWHTTPLPAGLDVAAYRYKEFATYGRQVGYATDSTGQKDLYNWLRENPHKYHLGRIGFDLKKSNGSPATLADLQNINQELDLWSGSLISRFELEGKPVRVVTLCHPDADSLAVTVDSPLLASGQLAIRLAFPYASHANDMADWKSPSKHTTVATGGGNVRTLTRTLDNDKYFVKLAWSGNQFNQPGEHEFVFGQTSGQSLELTCLFTPDSTDRATPPSAAQTKADSAAHWADFWSHGGCIDLSASSDARAPELERRIVLSQYNTALHGAGPLPPAETGLLCNSTWYGKFHLEMHWWHSAHFAVWNRFSMLERSLPWYRQIMHVGLATAARQGYSGCRWPKMTGPDGTDSPSPIAPLLIWQQPHPIYYAELSYRQNPTDQTLAQWREVVFQGADFMASYAVADQTGRYVLGPPLKTVSENTETTTNINPTFELAYWRFGLRVAQQWRQRMGMAPDPKWAMVLAKLSPLPANDGLYLLQEGMTDTYTKWNYEHPALIGAFGMQPGDGVDPATMRRTIQKVMQVWQFDRAWGWDFPMAAMTAARCGEPELAIQALMIESPKNRYHPNGHVYQRPGLTSYLPANGGLLSATAMMAAGWTGSPRQNAPGFPNDGKWSVKWEGLRTWM
jgi:hypothetical protein